MSNVFVFFLLSRFIQGTYAEAPYAFYHWQYIDIFNYFTHNMVTIPPAVWTNAAHKHGVLVLGEQKDKYEITTFRLCIQSFMICLSSFQKWSLQSSSFIGTRDFHHRVEWWSCGLWGIPQRWGIVPGSCWQTCPALLLLWLRWLAH